MFAATVFLLGVLPTNVFADEGANSAATVVEINEISKPAEVTQGDGSCGVSFTFTLSKGEVGKSFAAGEQIEIPTNLGDLFEADWDDFPCIEIVDGGQVLATVSLTGSKIVVTVADGADGVESMSGSVTSVNKLTAKDFGATEDSPVVKQLAIGDKTQNVTFKASVPYQPEDGSSLSAVDIATSWKNAWAIQNNTGAVTQIEVNPISSMELYGYYTWPASGNPNTFHGPGACDNLMIKDVIQSQGYVDQSTVKIYAVVPKLAVRTTDANFNGYQVPAGTYYAARQGSMRYRIDAATAEDSGRALLTRLVQNEGETYAQFEARVASSGLQWGIYYDVDANTETFLCNFGGVGFGPDEAGKNNGIMYSDYGYDVQGQSFGEKNFWSDNGPTAGNIVSYYIEYQAYYPDVVGEQTVSNTADCLNATTAGITKLSGNTATFTINNGDGSGNVRKRMLDLLLVDSVDHAEPIAGATFKIQVKKNGGWVDTGTTATTDEKGHLSVGPFPNGEYKVVQTSTADGYAYSNSTYGAGGDPSIASPSQTGEFVITGESNTGVATVVTNELIPTSAWRVEHYQEQLDGTYQLVDVDAGTGRVGDTVTATSKTYDNYHVNADADGAVMSGTLAAGGLTLKVFYNLDLHAVSYDPAPEEDDNASPATLGNDDGAKAAGGQALEAPLAQTGDTTNMPSWLMALVSSGSVLAGLLFVRLLPNRRER